MVLACLLHQFLNPSGIAAIIFGAHEDSGRCVWAVVEILLPLWMPVMKGQVNPVHLPAYLVMMLPIIVQNAMIYNPFYCLICWDLYYPDYLSLLWLYIDKLFHLSRDTCPRHFLGYVMFLIWLQTQRRARIRKLRLEEGARKALEELEKCNCSINTYVLKSF